MTRSTRVTLSLLALAAAFTAIGLHRRSANAEKPVARPQAQPTQVDSIECGGFTDTYAYTVQAYGGLPCETAIRIVKNFLGATESPVGWDSTTSDGTLAGTIHTSPAFPGWQCGEGSGGGSCSKGDLSAGYQSLPTPP